MSLRMSDSEAIMWAVEKDPALRSDFCNLTVLESAPDPDRLRAKLDDALRARLAGAPLLFFDGTLFTNDEMIAQGLLNKTGDRMGHMNMSGSTGSIEQLAPLGVGRKIFIHINNSNPALREDSPERAAVERAGWEVSYDGMEVRV
jgi:pyrroloquinoline quinone biosynthesis protein B